jgi:hypothetical protein
MFVWFNHLAISLFSWFWRRYAFRVACLLAYISLMAAFIAAFVLGTQALVATAGLVPSLASVKPWLDFLLPPEMGILFGVNIGNYFLSQIFIFEKETAQVAQLNCS